MIAGYLALASGTGNAVLRNSLRGHDRVGIDLGGDGPTLNDADDADAGANNLQNYPEILSVRKPLLPGVSAIRPQEYSLNFSA